MSWLNLCHDENLDGIKTTMVGFNPLAGSFLIVFLQCSQTVAFSSLLQLSKVTSSLKERQQQRLSPWKLAASSSSDVDEEKEDDRRRRAFLSSVVASTWMLSTSALADGTEDLTSSMFNADGSLKEGVASEAKERTVRFVWDDSDQLQVNVDGKNSPNTKEGKTVRLSYNLPEKWGVGPNDLYVDRSEGVNQKACTRVTVYQAAGTVTEDRLEKATTIGIGKALDAVEELSGILGADIISGRKTTKGDDDDVYFEFDMAVAPETCGESKANLGLGFCPYDRLYLLSATVLEGNRLFVLGVESNYQEWRQGNADLKRVRSSFNVSTLTPPDESSVVVE